MNPVVLLWQPSRELTNDGLSRDTCPPPHTQPPSIVVLFYRGWLPITDSVSNRSSAAHEWFPYPPFTLALSLPSRHMRACSDVGVQYKFANFLWCKQCVHIIPLSNTRMFWKISNTLESRNSGLTYLYINFICIQGYVNYEISTSKHKGNITQICKRSYEGWRECQMVSKL